MPGEASQRIPVQWGVEAIVDPWVLLPHQHLSTHTTKSLTAVDDKTVLEEHFFEVSFRSHHDDQGHVCWPQSFQSFWCVSGSPVVEGGTGNLEPARRVNGQLPVDEVLVPFTLQH